MLDKDYYEVLGVSPTSDQVVIRAAYKAMMLKYHPDTNATAEAEARAKAINEAYAVIGNPAERSRYDASREPYPKGEASQRGAPPNPPSAPESDIANLEPREKSSRVVRGGLAIVIALIVFLAGSVLAVLAGLESAPENEETAQNDTSIESPTPLDLSTATLGGTSESKTEESVPTIGQFLEKIDTGVQDFARVLKNRGISGAAAYSQDCQIAAKKTNNILETDYCTAFDMSAIMMDYSFSNANGVSQNEYFKERAANLDLDYNRFPQVSPNRTEIIWAEVGAVLEKHIQSTLAEPDN